MILRRQLLLRALPLLLASVMLRLIAELLSRCLVVQMLLLASIGRLQTLLSFFRRVLPLMRHIVAAEDRTFILLVSFLLGGLQ